MKNYNQPNPFSIYPTPHVKQILAFGDSLTEGMFDHGQRFAPYTTVLESLLNQNSKHARYHVINDGVSGECIYTEMATRLPLSLKQYHRNLKLVIILGGTNDLRKLDCKNNLNLAYEIIRLHEISHQQGYKTVVVTIPEANETKNSGMYYRFNIYEKIRKQTNSKLRYYASQHPNTTILCDLATKFPMHRLNRRDKKRYWADNLHPTPMGYRVIAHLLYQALQKHKQLWYH